MRDIFFIFMIPFLLYPVMRKPFIGAALWLWTSMHFPNGWLYGIGSSIRFNLLIVVVAFISYLVMKNKPKIPPDGLAHLIGIFLVWTLMTSIFTISIPEVVWAEWIEFFKISLLFYFCLATLSKKLHLNVMIWALVFSIGFYGCLEGLKYIATGGGHSIHGFVGHVLGDRNELALSFNMLLPLLVYLIKVTENKTIKLGLSFAILLIVVAIVGTNSRGGLVALIVVAGYFWLQSKRKFIYALLFSMIVGVGVNYVPDRWVNRMNTIENASEDNSFLGRVLAWKTAVLIANDNPITGGGFKSGQLSVVWLSYAGYEHYNDIVDTSHMGDVGFKAAHSIYFQVLGDHGYIGLLIFLSILLVAYRKAGRLARHIEASDKKDPLGILCRMIRVSIVAYCAGGGAVSLAYFDMIYALFAMLYVVEHRILKLSKVPAVVERKRREQFA